MKKIVILLTILAIAMISFSYAASGVKIGLPVSHDPANNATGYKYYFREVGQTDWTEIMEVASQTSDDPGRIKVWLSFPVPVLINTDYEIAAKAFNAYGESDMSGGVVFAVVTKEPTWNSLNHLELEGEIEYELIE